MLITFRTSHRNRNREKETDVKEKEKETLRLNINPAFLITYKSIKDQIPAVGLPGSYVEQGNTNW